MTYEASASLSIFLNTMTHTRKPSTIPALLKAGLGISANSIAFTITPSSQDSHSSVCESGPEIIKFQTSTDQPNVMVDGDMMTVRSICLDLSMWRLGGAAIPLRLVQLAQVHSYFESQPTEYMSTNDSIQTSHELSRTLAILANGMRNDWQNSDDIERLRESIANIVFPPVLIILQAGTRYLETSYVARAN